MQTTAAQQEIDESGRRSRGGYHFQDLCALRYCIQIAKDESWDAVWCESHDDIVLFKERDGIKHFRMAQVKLRFDPAQHWSCALLCELPNRDASLDESVLCKLFRSGRADGENEYRLVVNEGVNSDLDPLRYHWSEIEPVPNLGSKGVVDLVNRLQSWCPPFGESISAFLERFLIEQHDADADAMVARISRELEDLLKVYGLALLSDERDTVFNSLYLLVFKAASASLKQAGNPERIDRDSFTAEVLKYAQLVGNQILTTADERPDHLVADQLHAIGADDGFIQTAQELRRRYYSTYRRHSGTALGDRLEAELSEVRVICNDASLAALVDGRPRDSAFLQDVLSRIRSHHEKGHLIESGIDLPLIHGMLYFHIGRGGLVLR